MQTDGANDSSDDELSQMIGTDESHGCEQLPIDGVDNSCEDELLHIDGARKSFDELLQTDDANDSSDYELLQTDGANDPVDDETSHNNRETQTNAVSMDGSWAQMSSRHNSESFRPMQISTPADRQTVQREYSWQLKSGVSTPAHDTATEWCHDVNDEIGRLCDVAVGQWQHFAGVNG